MIDVTQTNDDDPRAFDVVLRDEKGIGRFSVTLAERDRERLAGADISPDAVVEAAFRFLLDREPRSAILPRFDITLISKYFPEFEARLGDYLSGSGPSGTPA